MRPLCLEVVRCACLFVYAAVARVLPISGPNVLLSRRRGRVHLVDFGYLPVGFPCEAPGSAVCAPAPGI